MLEDLCNVCQDLPVWCLLSAILRALSDNFRYSLFKTILFSYCSGFSSLSSPEITSPLCFGAHVATRFFYSARFVKFSSPSLPIPSRFVWSNVACVASERLELTCLLALCPNVKTMGWLWTTFTLFVLLLRLIAPPSIFLSRSFGNPRDFAYLKCISSFCSVHSAVIDLPFSFVRQSAQFRLSLQCVSSFSDILRLSLKCVHKYALKCVHKHALKCALKCALK